MKVRAARMGEGTVRRVMALLMSLALLAEQAASRSAPVRLLVLWLARRAEAVAGDYCFDIAGIPPSAVMEPAGPGNGATDALRLASRLRLLASLLAALLPDERRPGRTPIPSPIARVDRARGRLLRLVRRAWQPNDTS